MRCKIYMQSLYIVQLAKGEQIAEHSSESDPEYISRAVAVLCDSQDECQCIGRAMCCNENAVQMQCKCSTNAVQRRGNLVNAVQIKFKCNATN